VGQIPALSGLQQLSLTVISVTEELSSSVLLPLTGLRRLTQLDFKGEWPGGAAEASFTAEVGEYRKVAQVQGMCRAWGVGFCVLRASHLNALQASIRAGGGLAAVRWAGGDVWVWFPDELGEMVADVLLLRHLFLLRLFCAGHDMLVGACAQHRPPDRICVGCTACDALFEMPLCQHRMTAMLSI
jgi:hypothetical protein